MPQVELQIIIYADALHTTPAKKPNGEPLTVRDVLINMFAVTLPEDAAMSLKDKMAQVELFRMLQKATERVMLKSEDIVALKERALKCYPAPAMFSQIVAVLEDE